MIYITYMQNFTTFNFTPAIQKKTNMYFQSAPFYCFWARIMFFLYRLKISFFPKQNIMDP